MTKIEFIKRSNDFFTKNMASIGLHESDALHSQFIDFYSNNKVSNLKGSFKFKENLPPIDYLFHAESDIKSNSIFSENEYPLFDDMIFFGECFLSNKLLFCLKTGKIFYENQYENKEPEQIYPDFNSFLNELRNEKNSQ